MSRCAACARAWTREEAFLRLGKCFVRTDLRRRRAAHLLAIERARLPETHALAARERERRRLVVELRALRASREPAGMALRRLRAAMRLMRNAREEGEASWRRCARCADGGVFGSGERACARCGCVVCAECGAEVVDGEEHRCDEADRSSLLSIRRDCRPCVRCRVPCFRQEGCAVMWCPHCHVFWNWSTGRTIEVAAPPHNPDHRAWLTRTATPPREVDDLPCGGMPPLMLLEVRSVFEASELDVPIVLILAHRLLTTAQRERRHYPRHEPPADHARLRVRLLLGDVTEPRAAQLLVGHELAREFKREVGAVLETLVLGGLDVLQRYCAGEDAWPVAIRGLRVLVDGSREALERVAAAYDGRAVPRISPGWEFIAPGRRGTHR